MPKVTSAPARAAAAARPIAAANAASSAIMWSEGSSSISASGSLSASARAATQAAGAVLRPTGSSSKARDGAVDLAQLLGDDKAMFFVGDQQRRGEAIAIGDAAHGLLQQAVRAEQAQQLLGIKRARHRPQPGARAAGQNDRMNHAVFPSAPAPPADAFGENTDFRSVRKCADNAPPSPTNRQIGGARARPPC